jgi:hypothetical protein
MVLNIAVLLENRRLNPLADQLLCAILHYAPVPNIITASEAVLEI